MAKRLLVVPDVHGRTFWKEPVRKYMGLVDRIVFLGDYLDPYRDEGVEYTPEGVYENLLEIIALKTETPGKVILLKGNHDQHYSSEIFYEQACGTRCNMRNWHKYHELFQANRALFQLAHSEPLKGTTYVFTHAGLTVYWLNKVNAKVWHQPDGEVSLTDPAVIDKLNQLDDDGLGQQMLSVVGHRRSWLGEKSGSVLWADIAEHPLPHAPKVYGLDQVFQVFGHTRLDGQATDMVAFDHLAMIDTQQCFIIDEAGAGAIVPVKDYQQG